MTAAAKVDATELEINPLTRTKKDRRLHKRVELKLGGRFLNDESEDHGMRTVNISCSGAMILSTSRPAVGTPIVCYFDDLGRVAASVIRRTPEGFAVKFNASRHKRDKLADKLTWLLNRERLGMSDQRESPRHPGGGPALVIRKDGRQVQCRVLDISLSGASFETSGPVPPIGEMVMAGNIHGEVVRATENSFAIRYVR